MNLTGETQPLVEQLMMVKRMQVGARTDVLESWGPYRDPASPWTPAPCCSYFVPMLGK